MRPDLRALLDAMLARGRVEGPLAIDELADAIVALGVDAAEVEEWMTRFEDAGGAIAAPTGGGNAERLKVVLAVARDLARSLGRTPTPAEISARAGMDLVHVRWALALGRTMGR